MTEGIVVLVIVILFALGVTFLVCEWLSDANRKIKWDIKRQDEEHPRLVEDDEATS